MYIYTTTRTNKNDDIIKNERYLFYLQFYLPIFLNILFAMLFNNVEYNFLLMVTLTLITCAVANIRVFYNTLVKYISIILSLTMLFLTYYYNTSDYMEITIIFIIYVICIVSLPSLFKEEQYGTITLFNKSEFTIDEIESIKSNIGILPALTFTLLLFNISLWLFTNKSNTTFSITKDKFTNLNSTECLQDILITLLKTIAIIIIVYIIISLTELYELFTDSSYMINEDTNNERYETYICNKNDKCFCSLGYTDNIRSALEYMDKKYRENSHHFSIIDQKVYHRYNHHHEMVHKKGKLKFCNKMNGFGISFESKQGIQFIITCFKMVKCLFQPFIIPTLIAIPVISYLIIDINDIIIATIILSMFVTIFTFINIVFYNYIFHDLDNSDNHINNLTITHQYSNSGLSCIHQLIEINHQLIYTLPVLLIGIIVIPLCILIYKNYLKEIIYQFKGDLENLIINNTENTEDNSSHTENHDSKDNKIDIIV